MLIGKVFFHLRKYGLTITLKRGRKDIFRLMRRLWLREQYLIYIKRLSNSKTVNMPRSFVFRKAIEEDIPKVINQFDSHYGNDGDKVLSHRIASGDRLLLGFMENDCQTICFLSWLSEKDPSFLAVKDPAILNEAVCLCRVLVPKQFRGMGVGREGIAYAEQLAFEEGYKEIWGFVLVNNEASKRMFESQSWDSKAGLIKRVFCGHKYYHVAL